MAEIIRMPRLSDTMEEGVIVGWLKKEGDEVEPGDILAEVETDKATMELESYHEGVLLYIGVKEGAVPVNGILAVIGEEGEDYQAQLEEEQAKDEGSSSEEETVEEPEVVSAAGEIDTKSIEESTPSQQQASAPAGTDDRIKVSPLAKSMATEEGINLANLQGTGDGGRIIKRDITEFLKNGVSAQGSASPQFAANPGESRDVPVSQMRKVIARRLSESKFSAPHFYVTAEINMDNAIAARKEINADAPPKISFNDLVVKAVATALRRHPSVNASWHGDKMVFHGDIHIGVAVAVEDGLMVPVVKYADQKTFSQINAEVRDKAGRARERKLQLDEMQGNTFTISNLGMFDVDEFTAIINPPDACILAVGSIVKKPVVRNDEIVIGNTMKVTLSADHRIVDGATAAQFLQTVRLFLENPVKMLV